MRGLVIVSRNFLRNCRYCRCLERIKLDGSIRRLVTVIQDDEVRDDDDDPDVGDNGDGGATLQPGGG